MNPWCKLKPFGWLCKRWLGEYTGYTQKNCAVSKVNKETYFSHYTGTTYTVSSGNCPSWMNERMIYLTVIGCIPGGSGKRLQTKITYNNSNQKQQYIEQTLYPTLGGSKSADRQDRRRGITGASVDLRTTQTVRFVSVQIGSDRIAVWVTPKASGQYLPATSCIQCVSRRQRHATRVIRQKRRSVLTRTATRQDASRATRSDRNGLGCQDRRRGITGASVEMLTTQAVRFGSSWNTQ